MLDSSYIFELESHLRTFFSLEYINLSFSVQEHVALTRKFERGGVGSRETRYYVWIPYICVAAALCTYLPAWLWHIIGHRATFDIPAMINQLAKMKLSNPEDRRSNLTIMAKHYEKVEQYSKIHVRLTDNFFKRALSLCMSFAGGGILTGN